MKHTFLFGLALLAALPAFAQHPYAGATASTFDPTKTVTVTSGRFDRQQ